MIIMMIIIIANRFLGETIIVLTIVTLIMLVIAIMRILVTLILCFLLCREFSQLFFGSGQLLHRRLGTSLVPLNVFLR